MDIINNNVVVLLFVLLSSTYSSDNVINSNGTIDENSNGDVLFESKNTVDLLPGFSAEGDVNFEVKMQDCNINN